MVRARVALAGAVLAVVAMAVLGIRWFGGGGDSYVVVDWDDYHRTADGLVVRTEDRCGFELVDPAVRETRRHVVVEVRADPPPVWEVFIPCEAVFRYAEVRVPLAEPLGPRPVYDAECVADLGVDDRCLRERRQRG